MAQIILDLGSGNTHKNNWDYLKRMLDELKEVDTGKHIITIKHQLFKEAGPNIPLDKSIFDLAYVYAKQLGYQTTSSVFDKESLDFLLQFDVPFVKIANNRNLDYLIGEIPRNIPIYISVGSDDEEFSFRENVKHLICVSEYPTTMKRYKEKFKWIKQYIEDGFGISDHTTNFGLWYRYEPKIIEWHYVLEHDPSNLDGGLFAKTPTMLKEVL